MDLVTLAATTSIGVFVVSVVTAIAKAYHGQKRLEETQAAVIKRLGDLENKEFMTVGLHERDQEYCRAEVYKDISALEIAISRVEQRIDRSEAQRDLAREEDVKWKTEMAKNIAEISAILKNEMYHHHKAEGYHGP